MNPTRNLLAGGAGAILVALALAAVGLAIQTGELWIPAVALFAIAGAVIFAAQWFPDLFKSPAARQADVVRREIDATVAALVQVAQEDGALAAERHAAIDRLLVERFGAPVSAAALERILADEAGRLRFLRLVHATVPLEALGRIDTACCELLTPGTPAMAERLEGVRVALRLRRGPLLTDLG